MDTDETVITKRLNMIIHHLSGMSGRVYWSLFDSPFANTEQFPDRVKAAEDLHAFAKFNEKRLYKLLQTCMDSQIDVRTLIKSSVSYVMFLSLHKI